MWKLWATFIFGIIVMVFPWLGFSPATESVVIFILGLLITSLAFLSARDRFIIMSHLNHEESERGSLESINTEEPSGDLSETENLEEESVVPEQQ